MVKATPTGAELGDLKEIFKKSKLSQILGWRGPSRNWRVIFLSETSANFSADFSDRFSTLRKFDRLLYSLPRLYDDIARCIGPDGELLDEASVELARIRRKKFPSNLT